MNAAVQISEPTLIEKWENVYRVLHDMPEHDRQKHWNMAQWGVLTECGTVACAAGHCGLDPWFRKRGFRLNFNRGGDPDITPPETYFGYEGTGRIFWDPTTRPVEAVEAEVAAFLQELKDARFIATEIGAPLVGAESPEHGGHYAGVMFGADRAPYLLIVGPEHDDALTWDAAQAWAAGLSARGFSDWVIFNRAEQRRCMDAARTLFKPVPYWSSELYAAPSGFAWDQHFADGYQDYWNRYDRIRARAVRRVLI